MTLRIIIFAFVALLAADALLLKEPKPHELMEKETAPHEDLHVKIAESATEAGMDHFTGTEAGREHGAIAGKNSGKTSGKKAKGKKKLAVRSVVVEGERIVLDADEFLNPKLEGHQAEEGISVRQTLRSDEGMAYYGEIRIGGQVQQGIYDTGSFDLVVLSACTQNQHAYSKKTHEPVCCSKKKCPKAAYNHYLSGNWMKNEAVGLGKITYGSGPVTVLQGFDHVEFKATNEEKSISDAEVPTKVIVDHKVDLFRDTNLQAIVGLGPGKFEERESRMIHHLKMKRFSVCFSQDPTKDGYLTWNDKDRKSDPAYVSVPAMGKLFWATKVVSFGIQGQKHAFQACEPSCGAVIDTGTSLLTPPKEVIEQISHLLDRGGVQDCSDMTKFPTLEFTLGDQHFSLPPEAYIGKVEEEVAGFKHQALAFPLLPMKKNAKAQLISNHTTLALKEGGQQEENFPLQGACALMLSEGDPTDATPWGPMVIFGMQLFRKYAIQFDLTGDMHGIKPTFTSPTRIMRFTEASPDCQHDSQGKTFNFKQIEKQNQRQLVGSKLQTFNLKKLRKSTFQGHLEKSRLDPEYKVAGHQFRYKNLVRI